MSVSVTTPATLFVSVNEDAKNHASMPATARKGHVNVFVLVRLSNGCGHLGQVLVENAQPGHRIHVGLGS